MKRIIFLSTIYFLLTTVVNAQSVDILWQGDTYTPPFYQGKSLWSVQSKITFIAIPTSLGNPANLYYKWTRNGTVLGNNNGIGKHTIAFLGNILSQSQTIRVDIISGGNEISASASAIVTPTTPEVGVYENNPLYGFMFHNMVGENYNLKEPEITFTAFPYFFSTLTRANGAVVYEWRTNTGGLETRNSVTYRAPENAVGSSKVSLKASHKSQITQDARKDFLVEFGQ